MSTIAEGLRPRQLTLANPSLLASIGVSQLLVVAGVYLSALQACWARSPSPRVTSSSPSASERSDG